MPDRSEFSRERHRCVAVSCGLWRVTCYISLTTVTLHQPLNAGSDYWQVEQIWQKATDTLRFGSEWPGQWSGGRLMHIQLCDFYTQSIATVGFGGLLSFPAFYNWINAASSWPLLPCLGLQIIGIISFKESCYGNECGPAELISGSNKGQLPFKQHHDLQLIALHWTSSPVS